MPGPYSSEGSKSDAQCLAKNLGIEFLSIPISSVFESYEQALNPVFGSRPVDATEENIQGQAFNFGLESRVTVMEMTRAILRLMGRTDLQPIIRNEAKKEIKDQSLDSQKARNLLGWAPNYDLEQGLIETILWYREFFGEKGTATIDTATIDLRETSKSRV